MTENSATVDVPNENNNAKAICNCVYSAANVLQVQSSQENVYRFAGKTASGGTDTLITVKMNDSKAEVTVNCEKMVICSMLLKDLKTSLTKAWWNRWIGKSDGSSVFSTVVINRLLVTWNILLFRLFIHPIIYSSYTLKSSFYFILFRSIYFSAPCIFGSTK